VTELDADDIYKNLSQLNNALRAGLKVKVTAQPTILLDRIPPARDLLKEPIQPDRAFTLQDVAVQENHWTFAYHDGKSKHHCTSPYLTAKICATAEEAHKFGEYVCELLNRLPTRIEIPPLDTAQDSPFMKHVETAAIPLIFPSLQWKDHLSPNINTAPSIKLANFEGHLRLTSTVSCFATDATKKGGVTVRICPDKVNMSDHVSVPSIPTAELTFLNSDPPPNLTEDNIPRFQKSASIIRYVQRALHGAIGTQRELEATRDRLLTPFATDPQSIQHQYGIYDGQRLFGIWYRCEHRKLNIRPLTTVFKHVEGGKVPIIGVDGLSRTRLSWVIERLQRVWFETANILEAWKAACTAADEVNSGTLSVPDIIRQYCQCSSESSRHAIHVCQGCLSYTTCSRMFWTDSGLRVCPDCDSDAAIEEQLREKKRGAALLLKIHLVVAKEQRRTSADTKTVTESASKIKASVIQWLNEDDTWKDTYTLSKNRIDTNATGENSWILGRDPFIASPDAIFAVFLADGRLVYHHPSNLVVTAQYLNLVKHCWIPAVLRAVRESQYLRKQPASAEAKEAYQNLMRHFDHIHVLSMKSDYQLQSRLGKTMSIKDYSALRESWIAGIVDAADLTGSHSHFRIDGAVAQPSCDGTADPLGSHWQPARIVVIRRLIVEIVDRFEWEIPTGQDGAPWLGPRRHMPRVWTWTKLWLVLTRRFIRMRDWCNRRWVTIDTRETILLEWVIQYCKCKGRDVFLGLEWTLFTRHPLCVAIAHMHHGAQMRTGWRTTTPEALTEHDESLNNILFETQLSNYCKFRYPESCYSLILEDILSIREECEWWVRLQPTVPPVSLPDDPREAGEAGDDSDNEIEVEGSGRIV